MSSEKVPSEMIQKTNKWACGLRARGGNNMRYAIEDALRQLPDVRDIWIMCDGDVRPFGILNTTTPITDDCPKPSSYSEESSATSVDWGMFLKRPCCSNVTFHFIALGKGADTGELQNMAALSGGSYIEMFGS
jgi:hypothetical protein